MTGRGVERLRHGVAPLLLYPLLALLSFPTLSQIVFGDRGLAYAHDVFDIPRTGVLADWIAHGPSLWNTHLTSGNALLAQGNGPYAVDVALGFVVGPFAAYAITAWLLAVVAGVSMHLFLRDSLGLSTAATVGGAVIYLFGFWHVVYNVAGPAVPLLLWLIDGAMRAGPRRWAYAVGGSVVGAIACYQGIVQVVLLGAGLQLVWVLLGGSGRRDLLRRGGTWLVMWALALGMFAPTVVTQLVMLPLSNRAVWVLTDLYDPTPLVALRDTVRLYASAVLGVPIGGGWGASPAVLGTYFLGVSGVVLLTLGAIARRHDRRTALLVILLVAIPVADLVSVLITPLQDQFGFLKSFQLVRVRHLYPFVLASVAALGLDRCIEAMTEGGPLFATLGRGRWRLAVVAAVAVPLVATSGVELVQLLSRRRQLLDPSVPTLGWALAFVAAVLGVLLLALVVIGLRRRTWLRSAGRLGVVLAILLIGLVGERVAYAHGERFIDGHLGTWADRLGETSGQAFLQAQPGIVTDRVLTFGEDANRMGAQEMLQADGYQAIYPVTYHAFFGALTAPYLDSDPAMATYFRSWGNRAYAFGPLVDPELVALDGVRWLYVVGDTVPSVPGAIERFHDGEVHVYEVPDVLPRAFIAGSVDIEPDRPAVIGALASATTDALRSTAFVAAGSPLAGSVGDPGAAGTAEITSYAPDRVEVAVHADRPGVLVLTDVMAPGWVAEVDGRPIDIATVDATFRGVPVDATARTVIFRYVPGFTYLGFVTAAFAVVITIAWGWLIRRRDRRGPEAEVDA